MLRIALGALPLVALLACAGETPPPSQSAPQETPPAQPSVAPPVETGDAAAPDSGDTAMPADAVGEAAESQQMREQEMREAAAAATPTQQQEMAQAMMAAQANAELADPGPDGFLTAEEEEGLRTYLENLQALGEELDMQSAAMGQLDAEALQGIQDGMAEMRALQPPTIANQEANGAVHQFHSLTSEMSQSLSDLLEHMPQGEPTPQQQQEMMPHVMEFQQKMQSLSPQMMTVSSQMAQIVSTDLGSDEAFAEMMQ